MIGGGKSKGSSSASGAQSWRELAGPRRKRLNSPQARRRRWVKWLKFVGVLVAAVLLVLLAYFLTTLIRNREEPIQISTPSREIEQVIFDTDGALTDRWLGSVIQLEKGTTMMEVDIYALKQSLENEAQVVTASVERIFPSSLKIVLKERVPVLRIALAGPDNQPEYRVVARDGTLYRGIGYAEASLSLLPFLQPYQRADGGMLPLRGIERVADLLDEALRRQPEFFRTWKVISLEHYSGDPSLAGEVIEVRSSLVPRIIFGASADFGQQLDRLMLILEYVKARGNPAIKRIDLSLRGNAAVQFISGRISSF